MSNNPFKSFDMKGKVVVITGGAGFLGKQYAEILALAGARVVLWDNKDDAVLQQVVDELHKKTEREFHAISVDITSEHEVRVATTEVIGLFGGRIDVLINNAAMNPAVGTDEVKSQTVAYEQYSIDLFRKEMEVNVTGAMNCIKAVSTFMMAQKSGVIVNVSSGVSVGAYDNRTYRKLGWDERHKSIGYTVSKTAIIGLTRQWAEHLGKHGVRVNSFSPGGVETKQMDPAFPKAYGEGTMLGRMAQIGEYAPVMLFLCSDASSYMTGHNLVVDAGKSAF